MIWNLNYGVIFILLTYIYLQFYAATFLTR